MITILQELPNFSEKLDENIIFSKVSIFNALKHVEDNVCLVFRPSISEEPVEKGQLYIAENAVYFKSNKIYSIDYPSILVHAIARVGSEDLEDFQPMIYCQLKSADATMELLEMEIIPQNSDSIDNIFTKMCECAALHPDLDENDENDDYLMEKMYTIDNIDELELNEMQQAALDHLSSVLQDDSRFEQDD